MLKLYPLNILKIQSDSSKISNLGQRYIFTENCTLIIHMNHFSYPITVVQIIIFEELQNIFSQPKSQAPNYRASTSPVFLTIECPPGVIFANARPSLKFCVSYVARTVANIRSVSRLLLGYCDL